MTHGPAGPGWLADRLAAGEIVIIDGAMGTELETRGAPMDKMAWAGAAIVDHADTVREIHEDYILAGADVIITNTFAAARHVLEPAGYGDMVEAVNRKAVEVAKAARASAADGPVAIAGSISHWQGKAGPEWREPEVLRATFREQAEILALAGVDIIALEMMMQAELAVPAVEAALATGLPVWIGCSCRRALEADRLTSFDDPGRDFDELLAALAPLGGGMLTIMHSEVADTLPGLELARRHWSGPMGAYPNSGYFRMPNWQFVDIIPPDALAAEARRWIGIGVQAIGGCCGLGPDHIRHLKETLPRARPGTR